MQRFTDLKVWQKAHVLALEVYKATDSFPRTEIFGLTSQIRRSMVSIPSNIAEGCARGGDGDFARFVSIALGSASELEYQLLLARDLQYLPQVEYARLSAGLEEIGRMLNGLSQSLRPRKSKGVSPSS